jgi:hypothetical protein
MVAYTGSLVNDYSVAVSVTNPTRASDHTAGPPLEASPTGNNCLAGMVATPLQNASPDVLLCRAQRSKGPTRDRSLHIFTFHDMRLVCPADIAQIPEMLMVADHFGLNNEVLMI